MGKWDHDGTYCQRRIFDTSRLVKISIETTNEQDKQSLWDLYDDFTRRLKKY